MLTVGGIPDFCWRCKKQTIELDQITIEAPVKGQWKKMTKYICIGCLGELR